MSYLVLQIVYLLALNFRIKNDGKFIIPMGLMYHITKLGFICLPLVLFPPIFFILTDSYLPFRKYVTIYFKA